MAEPKTFNRRAFLALAGILGAVLGTGGVVAALPVWAGGSSSPSPVDGNSVLEGLVGLLRPALDFLAHDTLSGLVAFSLPGTDVYSQVEGVLSTTAGAVQARGAEFM